MLHVQCAARRGEVVGATASPRKHCFEMRYWFLGGWWWAWGKCADAMRGRDCSRAILRPHYMRAGGMKRFVSRVAVF